MNKFYIILFGIILGIALLAGDVSAGNNASCGNGGCGYNTASPAASGEVSEYAAKGRIAKEQKKNTVCTKDTCTAKCSGKNFTDENKDGKCDSCGCTETDCKKACGAKKCENDKKLQCAQGSCSGKNFTDTNKDGKCDSCGIEKNSCSTNCSVKNNSCGLQKSCGNSVKQHCSQKSCANN